jgi:hypothetical protein
MSRRLTRGQRVQRRAEYWQERLAAATSPAERTAVAFDWARARVTGLPPHEQDTEWRELFELLSGIAPDDTTSHVNSHPRIGVKNGPTHRAARTRARPTLTN